MNKLITTLVAIVKEEEGAGMVEYVVGVGLIAAAVVAGATVFGDQLEARFSEILPE